MIPGLLIIIFLAIVFLKSRNEKQDSVFSAYEGQFMYRFYMAGLWLLKYCREVERTYQLKTGKRRTFRKQEEMEQRIYFSKKESDRKKGMRLGEMLLILLLGCPLLILSSVFLEKPTEVSSVERPAYGKDEAVELKVKGIEGVDSVSFTIGGKEPDETEANELFDEAFKELLLKLPGENASLSEITTDLTFPKEAENGVRFRYRSSDPERLSDYGKVGTDMIVKPEEVSLLVGMSLSIYERQETIPLVLLPAVSEEAQGEGILEVIKKEADEQREEGEILLPEYYEGKSIRFYKDGQSPFIFPLLLFSLTGILWFSGRDKVKKEYEKRNKELQRMYPNLLSKLITLLQAGMSIRGAVFRMTEDYRKRREKTGKREYVYEELLITENLMNSGVSEEEAYIDFGRRCNSSKYLKFGNLLAQNHRQGISGFSGVLREEMSQALQEERNRLVRKGEEASTKLLFPMLLMLGVVIVSLIVPAFMSF